MKNSTNITIPESIIFGTKEFKKKFWHLYKLSVLILTNSKNQWFQSITIIKSLTIHFNKIKTSRRYDYFRRRSYLLYKNNAWINFWYLRILFLDFQRNSKENTFPKHFHNKTIQNAFYKIKTSTPVWQPQTILYLTQKTKARIRFGQLKILLPNFEWIPNNRYLQ